MDRHLPVFATVLARALRGIPVAHRDGVGVHLHGAISIELAHAALSAIESERDRLRRLLDELAGGQSVRVPPARVRDRAMADIPDSSPPDFA
ncbi:hypothetical protein DKG71_04105 [Streptomyces sp. NEAU-S7GS2]|nr:hypothetical protein DKG71_04105 [Streptomyces sp. NEAU-S7GS2]